MIGSAMRLGEVPLLMSVDVDFYGDDLWVALRERDNTIHFGKAKTGPRTIFIGWDHRIITAWQNWIRSRQVLVDRWMGLTGQPDHGMFLTNRDGSPLTTRGIQTLFSKLNAKFRRFGGEFVEDQFQIHPHAIRHTVESLFEEWGIPHHVRQRHPGHKKPETTDLYGKVYRKTYVRYLSEMELIDILNERFGTDFTQADQLFFDQIQEEAVENETLKKAAAANSKADFRYVFEKAFEGLIIDRMEGNEEIFARLMSDGEFRKLASEYLLNRVYNALQRENDEAADTGNGSSLK